jgi:hypothetical protein
MNFAFGMFRECFDIVPEHPISELPRNENQVFVDIFFLTSISTLSILSFVFAEENELINEDRMFPPELPLTSSPTSVVAFSVCFLQYSITMKD